MTMLQGFKKVGSKVVAFLKDGTTLDISGSGVRTEFFDTPGTYTWTVPANVSSCYIYACGAGGQGRRPGDPTGTRGGGGGGGVSEKFVTSLREGQQLTIVVGTGPSNGGGTTPGPTAAQETSLTLPDGSTITCPGGLNGGTAGNPADDGALGSVGSGGDINYSMGHGWSHSAANGRGGGPGGGKDNVAANDGGSNAIGYGSGTSSARYNARVAGDGLVKIT